MFRCPTLRVSCSARGFSGGRRILGDWMQHLLRRMRLPIRQSCPTELDMCLVVCILAVLESARKQTDRCY